MKPFFGVGDPPIETSTYWRTGPHLDCLQFPSGCLCNHPQIDIGSIPLHCHGNPLFEENAAVLQSASKFNYYSNLFLEKEYVRSFQWEALLRVQGTVGIPGASIATMHLCEHLPGLVHQKLQLHMGVLGNWRWFLQKIPFEFEFESNLKRKESPNHLLSGYMWHLNGIITECSMIISKWLNVTFWWVLYVY